VDARERDEALLADPAALAELRGRYSGGIDPVDVLRWRLDPSAVGSGGSRSPMARADDLAPLVYGRADSREAARRRDEAAAEVEALRAEWRAASAALDAAMQEPHRDDPPEQEPRRRLPLGRLALVVGASAVAVVVLVGVAVALQPRTPDEVSAGPTTSAPRPTPTPTPTKTATPQVPAPPPVATPTPTPDNLDYRRDYFEDDINTVLEVPLNGPPIDNANGAVTVDDYGVPLSYVVASGDVFELIAKRFDLGTTYLASINAVRRDNPTELFVGDTINLGATTILRIGDQNGVVYDHVDRLPEPHMPQE
jgi:hypothetical protein